MFQVRPVDCGDVPEYVRTMMWAAGRPVDEDLIASATSSWDLEHALAAFEGEKLIGTIGTRSLTMVLPGGPVVPVACIGQGGVLPSHTRRGAMHQLMLESLSRAVDRGAACAAWTTSAWPLYARYGGGVATFAAARRIEDMPSVRIESPPTGNVELAASAEVGEQIVALHERACQRPGSVPRDVRYWRERLRRADLGLSFDVLDASASAPPAMYALRRPGGNDDPDGCAMYRVHQRWDGGLFRSELEILDFVAVDDEAAADLWRFLLRLDLVDRLVIGHGPVDTALRWLLNDGRRLQTTAVFDHVWLRVLDAERVLSTRTYPALGEPLLLAVRDPLGLCDDGTFLLESDGASTSVSRIEPHAAQIEVDVALLSTILLGSGSLRALAAAGRLPDLDERQVRLLQHAFSAERAPYCDNSF